MTFKIEVNKFKSVETNNQDIIDQAINDGFTVIEMLPDPNNYKEDGSDRPEFVSQAVKDAVKAEQDNINDIENRPVIIASLDEIPYQELTKAEYEVLPFDQLTEYHSKMVEKQKVIREVIIEKGLEDTKENWDIEGVKTKDELIIELKNEKVKE